MWMTVSAPFSQRGGRTRQRYLEEEVEAKQSDAGDDGEASGVSTGDGLWDVGSVLRGERRPR